jgi:hypothetical protein
MDAGDRVLTGVWGIKSGVTHDEQDHSGKYRVYCKISSPGR